MLPLLDPEEILFRFLVSWKEELDKAHRKGSKDLHLLMVEKKYDLQSSEGEKVHKGCEGNEQTLFISSF